MLLSSAKSAATRCSTSQCTQRRPVRSNAPSFGQLAVLMRSRQLHALASGAPLSNQDNAVASSHVSGISWPVLLNLGNLPTAAMPAAVAAAEVVSGAVDGAGAVASAAADGASSTVSAAADAVADTPGLSPSNALLVASPLLLYAIFNAYRTFANPKATFNDFLFFAAGVAIIANIVSIVAFKTRLI